MDLRAAHQIDDSLRVGATCRQVAGAQDVTGRNSTAAGLCQDSFGGLQIAVRAAEDQQGPGYFDHSTCVGH
jgi:hypothetical protein